MTTTTIIIIKKKVSSTTVSSYTQRYDNGKNLRKKYSWAKEKINIKYNQKYLKQQQRRVAVANNIYTIHPSIHPSNSKNNTNKQKQTKKRRTIGFFIKQFLQSNLFFPSFLTKTNYINISLERQTDNLCQARPTDHHPPPHSPLALILLRLLLLLLSQLIYR